MSKEIAQTVKSKRLVALVAILAAFAVFATLGSQWRGANAALTSSPTIVQNTAPTNPTAAGNNTGAAYTATATYDGTAGGVLSITYPANVVVGNPGCAATGTSTWTPGVTGTAPAAMTQTCTINASGTAGTLTMTSGNVLAYLNAANGTAVSGNVTATITGGSSASVAMGAFTISNASGTVGTAALGTAVTVTFTLPAGITYCSDAAASGANPRVSNGTTDRVITGPTVVSETPSTANNNVSGTHTFKVTGTGTIALNVHAAGLGAGTSCNSLQTATISSANYVAAELRHIADDGTVITVQDAPNNVRGSSHTVCTVLADTTTATTIPLNALSQISVTNGGGYGGTAVVGPQSPTFTNPAIFIGTGAAPDWGLSGATCFSWTSTGAGDQQISVIYTGLDSNPYTVNFDSNNSITTLVNKALIKQWNVLEDSVVNSTGANITKSIALAINPATGRYQGTAYSITDIFRGSHTTSSGSTWGPDSLAGVAWTASSNGACGSLTGSLTGTTTLTSPSAGVGNTPSLSFVTTSGPECMPGVSTVVVTITGSEPGPLGSGTGRTVTETVTITFTQTFATKQVFLAWAGQRVILEHDWRMPGNLYVSGTAVCPFGVAPTQTFDVAYVKGGGPGNFLPSLSDLRTGASENAPQLETGSGVVVLNGADEADVLYIDASDTVQDNTGGSTDDLPLGPQDSCISRVLYESEDQGEVDIEAFVTGVHNGESIQGTLVPLVDNQTKVAFVVYYMKIENVAVSLVSQVAKPTHNSSVPGLNDYDPGNPWDASKDVTTVDWNVSKDLLVRGRVKGWFLNSNPSGRAADTTNALNALPANRWVMPDDWDLLAGGPHGEEVFGTAEAFRPEYDIMFAPNNAAGIALGSPTGIGVDMVTTVAAGTLVCPNTTTSFRVASSTNLVVGSQIYIGTGTTLYTVTAKGTSLCSTTYITISIALSAAPAVGTPIYLTNTTVPFEGPYSLLDTPGLAVNGLGSAAVSSTGAANINPPFARDTILADGDVDWWDAPMPPALITARIRGAGFIKQVLKQDVYYIGTANSVAQVYPNAFYVSDIPDSPFIPAVTAGGGYLWDSWGADGPGIGLGQGPYNFWQAAKVGSNIFGTPDVTLSATDAAELAWIRTVGYPDSSIARDLVVYSDNHGEFMVTANGDFKLDYKDCVTNALGGGKHCKQGDKVGTSSIDAVADYPDYRGKHFPVASNAATVTWTWAGYKDVTIEKGESDQYKYVVFHALDRDGFCDASAAYAESLHPVLSGAKNDTYSFTNSVSVTTTRPPETVDFLIDSGDGIILATSSGSSVVNTLGNRQFAPGVLTYDLATQTAIGAIKVFPAINASKNECQAWIKISNSLLGVTNVLTIAHDDEGDIGIDKIVDLQSTMSYSLSFRWSLVTWAGANNVSPTDALKGTGAAAGGNDIFAQVTAVYGWDQAAQAWLAFFPSGVNVPGANDLTKLVDGNAYWVAITAPGPVTWTIATNVG